MTHPNLPLRPAMLAAALSLSAALGGCATGPAAQPGDPFEPLNRATFKLNTELDNHIAQPVAKGYRDTVPSPLRTAIHNFFANLGDVGNFANNLLQLRLTDAAEDLMRVAMNSMLGVAGLADVATPAGLPRHHQDFGLTMARWGVPSGPYLVLPLFGPSSVRDGIGLAADVHFTPLGGYVDPAVRNPLYVTQFVSARADMLGATDLLKQAALDPYSFVRDAYIQQRKSMTYKGGSNSQALPNYGDPGAAAPASGASATGVAEPGDLPKYDDPDAPASAPATAPASTTEPRDLPQYDDPGATPAATPASGTAAASAPSAAN